MSKKKTFTKKLILGVVDDLVGDFLYYGRKEDEELGVGEIEKAIEEGIITPEEIAAQFLESLKEAFND